VRIAVKMLGAVSDISCPAPRRRASGKADFREVTPLGDWLCALRRSQLGSMNQTLSGAQHGLCPGFLKTSGTACTLDGRPFYVAGRHRLNK
jgi:hypothetical protein